MDWGSPEFVIAIVAISTFGWVLNNWIRAKHGYELEDEWGGKTARSDTQEMGSLGIETTVLVGVEHPPTDTTMHSYPLFRVRSSIACENTCSGPTRSNKTISG